jgi:hypothetical protein
MISDELRAKCIEAIKRGYWLRFERMLEHIAIGCDDCNTEDRLDQEHEPETADQSGNQVSELSG